jgi:hypothetical protein
MCLPLLSFSLPELTTTQQFMISLPETAAAPGAEVETDGNDLRTRLHCAWRLVTSAATLDLGFMHSLTPPQCSALSRAYQTPEVQRPGG